MPWLHSLFLSPSLFLVLSTWQHTTDDYWSRLLLSHICFLSPCWFDLYLWAIVIFKNGMHILHSSILFFHFQYTILRILWNVPRSFSLPLPRSTPLFSTHTTLCLLWGYICVFKHQDQFVLPEYPRLCDISLEYGWLSRSHTLRGHYLSYPSNYQLLLSREWELLSNSYLSAGIWFGLNLHGS